VDFNSETPGVGLRGRLSHYLVEPGTGEYRFAQAKELRNPSRGEGFAMGNTLDPQGEGFIIFSWAGVMNTSDKAQQYTFKLYNQEGQDVGEPITFALQPNARYDLAAGHQSGPGVYTAQFQPKEGSGYYLAEITRYGTDLKPDDPPRPSFTHSFAINSFARGGAGDHLYAATTNDSGTCWTQSNWIEIVNVRSKLVTANLTFRSAFYTEPIVTSVAIPPLAQRHINASALLPEGGIGSVEIVSNEPGSLIAQSSVYFHDCASNRLQTSYTTPARIAGEDFQAGTFNLSIGMTNFLRVMNVKDTPSQIVLNVTRLDGSVLLNSPLELQAGETSDIRFNDLLTFQPEEPLYGVIRLEINGSKRVVAESLRYLESADGRMDFAFPTVVR
jgi:hypothetical protein